MVKGEGRKGFFRWNEDICKFIQANWDRLMPHRKKTQSWHSTVAGALSVHCPALFQSGSTALVLTTTECLSGRSVNYYDKMSSHNVHSGYCTLIVVIAINIVQSILDF